MRKPDISAAIQTLVAPPHDGSQSFMDPSTVKNIPQDTLGTLGQLTELSKDNGEDILRDINKFISAVLKLAGFNFGKESKGWVFKDIAGDEQVWKKYFSEIEAKDVEPGDLISYMSSEDRNVGFVESYNPETQTGKMYGSGDADNEVRSIDINQSDINKGANFLRPLMSFFTGTAIGMDETINFENAGDYDEYMDNSYYPSPSP